MQSQNVISQMRMASTYLVAEAWLNSIVKVVKFPCLVLNNFLQLAWILNAVTPNYQVHHQTFFGTWWMGVKYFMIKLLLHIMCRGGFVHIFKWAFKLSELPLKVCWIDLKFLTSGISLNFNLVIWDYINLFEVLWIPMLFKYLLWYWMERFWFLCWWKIPSFWNQDLGVGDL